VSALTITHQIAAPLEVIPQELGDRAQKLARMAAGLVVADAATMQSGNQLMTEAHAMLKELEAARTRLKKPITDLGREIDRVVAAVADPLEAAKKSAQGKVIAFQRAEQAKAEAARREAEEKARQEREAAEKERARLQAEADAKAKAEADELAAVTGTVVAPTPVKVEEPKPAPAPAIPAAPVLPKAAVQVVEVPVMVVKDPAALAAFLVAAGKADLIEFKMRDIKSMVDAGVAVAGVVVEMRPQTRMARS
jgi:hypothetical protein